MSRKIKKLQVIKLFGGKPRDSDRIPRILAKFEKIWKGSPDLRFLQMVSNLQANMFDNPFYLEDNELEERLDNYIKKHNI